MKKRPYISPIAQCYTMRCSLLLSDSETEMPWSGLQDDSSGNNSTEEFFWVIRVYLNKNLKNTIKEIVLLSEY